MTNLFRGVDWAAGIDFTQPAYAQKFLQLISDIYASFIYGGYFIVGTTTSQVPATGSQTFAITQDRVVLGPGMFVICASAVGPTNSYIVGIVTANSGTVLTVNGLIAVGTGADTNWNICAIASVSNTAPGTTKMGQTGQTTSAAVLQALNIDTPAICAEPVFSDFGGAMAEDPLAASPTFQLDNWIATCTNGGAIRPNAATLYLGDTAKYNLDPTKSISTLTDWAAHPGVIALEASAVSDAVLMTYGTNGATAVYGITNTSSQVMDVHLKVPVAFSAADCVSFVASISNSSSVYISPEDAATSVLGFVIGRGIGYNPMRLYVVESVAGVPVYTDTGVTLSAGLWYTIRVARTSYQILRSDNAIGTASVLSQGSFTAHTISDGMSPQMSIRKLTGSSKRAMLVDYYAFKPGAITR